VTAVDANEKKAKDEPKMTISVPIPLTRTNTNNNSNNIPINASPMASDGHPIDLISVPQASNDIALGDFMMDSFAEENSVYGVLVFQTPYGFPAFNQSNQLIGFYQHDDTSNVLGFVALQLYDGKIDAPAKEIQAQYDRHRENESSCIVTRADCITLDKLKEQTILLHFSNQAQQTNNYFSI